MAETGAERLLVLGDLVHAKRGLTAELLERISTWRASVKARLVLVRGNHDRALKEVPSGWNLDLVEGELAEGPFTFAHEPRAQAGRYVWAGHLHPTYCLVGGGDRIRLPCFHLTPETGVLPAFSAFTGGHDMPRTGDDRIFVVVEGKVVEV